MPARTPSRRRLLSASVATFAGLTGCLAGTPASSPTESPSRSPTDETTTETRVSDGTTSVASLSVADFILYALAGTHPHVHRRADTQYVLVRVATSLSAETIRERLTLTLDGAPASLADHQPVPWEYDTVAVAFAVSKAETSDEGRVLLDGTELRSLSGPTIDRLNAPPVFEVSDLSVSPDEVRSGERTSATVQFDLRNVGDGRGTFGASLAGNFLSGSLTVTTTLDPGAHRELTPSTDIAGEGDEATVRLDWGADEWSTDIRVIGTPTTTALSSSRPSPPRPSSFPSSPSPPSTSIHAPESRRR